eukprot:739133-Hanusia_phi.AAC.2
MSSLVGPSPRVLLPSLMSLLRSSLTGGSDGYERWGGRQAEEQGEGRGVERKRRGRGEERRGVVVSERERKCWEQGRQDGVEGAGEALVSWGAWVVQGGARGAYLTSTTRSGFMLLEPNMKTFKDMQKKMHELPSYDDGDQGFLNAYFGQVKEEGARE